jgi:hypothetical protein
MRNGGKETGNMYTTSDQKSSSRELNDKDNELGHRVGNKKTYKALCDKCNLAVGILKWLMFAFE